MLVGWRVMAGALKGCYYSNSEIQAAPSEARLCAFFMKDERNENERAKRNETKRNETNWVE